MNDKIRELVIVNWETTLSGVVAGTVVLLESNGGAFNATWHDWVKAASITLLGLYAKSAK